MSLYWPYHSLNDCIILVYIGVHVSHVMLLSVCRHATSDLRCMAGTFRTSQYTSSIWSFSKWTIQRRRDAATLQLPARPCGRGTIWLSLSPYYCRICRVVTWKIDICNNKLPYKLRHPAYLGGGWRYASNAVQDWGRTVWYTNKISF